MNKVHLTQLIEPQKGAMKQMHVSFLLSENFITFSKAIIDILALRCVIVIEINK